MIADKYCVSEGGMRKYKVINGRVVYEKKKPNESHEVTSASGYYPLRREVSSRVLRALEYAESKAKTRATKITGDTKIFNAVTSGYDNICNGSRGLIQLDVRKGKHIFQLHYCADCKELFNPVWRYRESNYGIIHLCNICKTLAFERTFGHADAMPLKIDHAHAHKGKWK